MFQFGPLQVLGLAISPFSTGTALSPSWIPVSSGLNVLYGLNGAGKSLILEGLEDILLFRETSQRESGHMELVLKIAQDAYKRDSDSTNWVYFTYARKEIAPFLTSFQRPGEYLTDFPDHWDEDGNAWIDIDDLLDRMEQAVAASVEQSALLPEGVTSEDVAAELIREQVIAFTRGQRGFVIRGIPSERSPVISQVIAWREEDKDTNRNQNWSSIESIWPSATEEARAVLPKIYEFCYLDADLPICPFPVLGRADFDPDAESARKLSQLGRGLPDSPTVSGVDREKPSRAASSRINILDSIRDYRNAIPSLSSGRWIAFSEDGDIQEQSGILEVVRLITADANAYYSHLLIDAPVLELDLGNPHKWLEGSGVTWGARRTAESPLVRLEDLSQAERRWARLAIELALQGSPSGFLIMDEPEQALHRAAEVHMAEGLLSLAKQFDLCVVVATHSTELLNQAEANIYLVRRSDQGLLDHQQVHDLSRVDREELREFGLLPSDLLRRQKGILLVEGEHDLIVWRSLLGEELDALRVEIIPIRGAGKLNSTLDSRVLYDFTDAHLFVLLDAMNSSQVTQIWEEACRLAKTQSPQLAAEYADSELKNLKVDESQALAAWASRALATGREGRHTPLALQRADVLEYLPVTCFVPNAHSWSALHDECATSQGGLQPSGTQFKSWLRKAKKVNLSPEAVRQAALSMDSIPLEFTTLLEQIKETLSDVVNR